MNTLITPFARTSRGLAAVVTAVEVLLVLAAWQLASGGLVPGPLAVLDRLAHLLVSAAFLENLVQSLALTLRSMWLSMMIALVVAYASVVPVMRPLAQLVMQLRYLTLTGLIFLFTLAFGGGAGLKLSLLIAGIVPFFVTGLLSVIKGIKQEEYDLCTTLGMGPWRTLWEVVIVGRADAVFTVVEQNFAIAWMMITMVEGVSMSEGGLGTLMIKSGKYIDLASVFAMLAVVMLIGIVSYQLVRAGRRWLFPFTR